MQQLDCEIGTYPSHIFAIMPARRYHLPSTLIPASTLFPPRSITGFIRMPNSNDRSSDEEPRKLELSSDSKLETTVVGKNQPSMSNDVERHDEPSGRDELTLSPNDCIGRYTVIKTLGSGGFGIVYLAQDPKLARKVAIKVSRSLDSLPNKLRISLVDEARAAASLDHPNIIRVFDVDQWQDRTYVVMELVEGKSLADVIAKQETIPLPRVLGIMRQIAVALEQLHAKGIIHRDLKPANILITENEQVKVTDLGLALTDDSTLWNAKHIAGTQRYMSPEQVLGEVHRIDGRTDIWAFGVVVFEMLTLQSPFRTNDRTSVFSMILKGEIASPRQRRPEIPDSLERLCLKCLSKRMTDRFQSAKQLSEAIAKIEADSKINNALGAVRPTTEPSYESQLIHTTTHRSATTHESKATLSERKSGSVSDSTELRGLVPRGLRAFSAEDSSYYHRLIPGPYDMEGRPAILNYWLKWIECGQQNGSSNSVGVIYGASGCGKSSFVLASLIPSLPSAIKTVYFNFTVQNPVQCLVQLLHERFPYTKAFAELPQILGAMRSCEEPFKVLFLFDQFEQYLINTHIDLEHVMVQAIRQCDGERLQAMILVRDEFWSEISQFMQMMELSLSDGVNASSHPLMNKVHARRVLESFGRAYEMLPPFDSQLTASQKTFIDAAIDGLAQDETVLCVRIAMFAELMKNYAWDIQTISAFGGVEVAVSRFLTDAFHSQDSPMSRRSVANVCIEILRVLLPEDDRELKSASKSLTELASAANESKESVRFTQSIRCLEADLRIISPTNAHSPEQHFNLAHDYLVRPIQNWLSAQDSSTWQGRAKQRLSMIASRYQREPSRANLLGIWDWLLATLAVSKARRSVEQDRVLLASGKRAIAWISVFALGIALIATFGIFARNEAIRAAENQRLAANSDILLFMITKSRDLHPSLQRLRDNSRIAKKEIEGLLPFENADQQRRQVLLKALLGANVAIGDIDQAVSKSDLGELELWKEYLSDKLNRDLVLKFLHHSTLTTICAEWHWLFLVRREFQLVKQIQEADDPGIEMYKLLAFAAQDEAPFLDPSVRAKVANDLIEVGEIQDTTYDTRMNLAAHLIGMDEFQRDKVPKPLVDFLEATKSDKDRSKALTSQWFLSKLEGQRVIGSPVESSQEWRMDEPIPGLPFVMIHIPEGALTFEIKDTKGIQQFGIVLNDNVWMAREEVSTGLLDVFFSEFPNYRDMDWPTEVSNELGATNMLVPTALHFFNWLSDKAGLERVYAFDAEKTDYRRIENLPKISIDVYANGFRLPTFDELRYAGIHGDFNSFWTLIATDEMLLRIAPPPKSPISTYSIYPNAWGFQGVTGSLFEMVVNSQWNIALARTSGGQIRAQIQTWNNPIPCKDETYSKISIAGFRIVQGAIENRPRAD